MLQLVQMNLYKLPVQVSRLVQSKLSWRSQINIPRRESKNTADADKIKFYFIIM